jgi:hypothetical protein
MIRNFRQHVVKRDIKREMNLALDHELVDEARSALDTHLSSSAQDAALWDRMQTVDHLLSAEPLVEAPSDFASKVMAFIAANTVNAPSVQENLEARSRAGLGAAFGLVLAVVITVPLVATALIAVQRWLSDPAALNTLLQQTVLFLNTIAQAVASFLQVIASYTVDNPILPALLTTLIPLTMIWGWLMWYTSLRRQQVVYRIPVRVA